MKYNFAIQHKASGQLIDYCETKEQVKQWLSNYPVECIDLNNAKPIASRYITINMLMVMVIRRKVSALMAV